MCATIDVSWMSQAQSYWKDKLQSRITLSQKANSRQWKKGKRKTHPPILFLSERRSLVHWAVRLSLSFSFANRLKFHYQQEQSETAHRKHTATSVNNIFPEIRDSPLTNARAGKRFFIGTVGHRWLQATRGNLSLSLSLALAGNPLVVGTVNQQGITGIRVNGKAEKFPAGPQPWPEIELLNRYFYPGDSGVERISNLAGNRGDAVSMRDGSWQGTEGGRGTTPTVICARFTKFRADPIAPAAGVVGKFVRCCLRSVRQERGIVESAVG